jgi:hypothetical protein
VKFPGLLALLVFFVGHSFAQTVPADLKLAAAVSEAREVLTRLDAAMIPVRAGDHEKKERKAVLKLLLDLEPKVAALKPPPDRAASPRAAAWRKLHENVETAVRQENEFWAALPDPESPVKIPAKTAVPLTLKTKEISGEFALLFPRLAPGTPISWSEAPPTAVDEASAQRSARAAAAMERQKSRGTAAAEHPELVFDGTNSRRGNAVGVGPDGSPSRARTLAPSSARGRADDLPVEPEFHMRTAVVPSASVPLATPNRTTRHPALAAVSRTAPEALHDAIRATPIVTGAAHIVATKGNPPPLAEPSKAAVPTPIAESPETAACMQTLKDHSSVAGLCKSVPTLAPILAGLLEALEEQFGTVQGLAMNIAFMLLGLVLSAVSGIGLIAKIVVGLASFAMLAFTLGPLIKQAWSAFGEFRNTGAGDVRHSRALMTMGKIGGTVLILALMSAVGMKLGKTGPGKALTEGATGKMSSAIKGMGIDMAALDAKVPASLRSFFGGAKPAAESAPEPKAADKIPRSAKSALQFSDDTVIKNSEIAGREARVEAAMKQLGAERGFAEKVADAHEKVPCAVGDCTPAELRAKLEIMGRGPEAESAIRSGLAGQPRLNLKTPSIRDFFDKYSIERWKSTVDEGAASKLNHIYEHHSPKLPDWKADGPHSLESRIKPGGIEFATKFGRESDVKASMGELRRLITSNVEHGGVRTEAPVADFKWNKIYRPASYYSILQKLINGGLPMSSEGVSKVTLQFKMDRPIGYGMGFDAQGKPQLGGGLRWVRATVCFSKKIGLYIETMYPAVESRD